MQNFKIKMAAVAMVATLASQAAWAGQDREFNFGTDAPSSVPADAQFSDQRGYGFEPGYPVASAAKCVTGEDVTFSVRVPEGNYRVTIRLGDPAADSQTAVKAESRRVLFPLTRVKAGEVTELTATVNVHTPRIDDQNSVHVSTREKEAAVRTWDDKLTLEFVGPHVALDAIKIARVEDAVTLFIAGDSTVCDQPGEPWAAWGQLLPQFFLPNVAIANYGESGRTLRSFKGDLRWAKLLSQVKPGDYVFIQFGHNDMKETGPGIGAFTSFSESLRQYISDVHSKRATPILVTPMHRRRFKDNQIVETFGDYPEAVRKVAAAEKVALIDLHAMSKPLYEAFGPDKSTQLFVHFPANTFPGQTKALKDDTHFRAFGADQIARCILQAIRDQKLPIAAYIRDTVPPFDPAKPNDPAAYDLPASKPQQLAVPEGR